jgi:hypothetical protein
MTFLAKVNAIGFLSLDKKVIERFLIFVVAELAEQSIDSPLNAATGTEEIPLSHFLLQ